ncbi:MAG: hypothetical protein WCE44_07750 [Candidatus Velthaea sp.]|jgi:hypothetical protein
MNIRNIDRILLFCEDGAGRVLTLEELRTKYGLEPDGTNFYYGLNSANLATYTQTGKAFNASHRAFFDALIASTKASASDGKTLVLGLEPLEAPSPYAFIESHLNLVRQLATDLAGAQNTVRESGKRLTVAIRFGSEMNDRAQVQGGNPTGFRSAFAAVRQVFAEVAPSILFSFSPGIRADLPEADIGAYWPGDALVDIIGGTWYVGAPAQRAASFANLRAYLLHRTGAGKPFAFSEVGGHGPDDAGNDAVLEDMLHELESMQIQNVSFKYATLFLQGVWGTDATLAFLRPPDGPNLA